MKFKRATVVSTHSARVASRPALRPAAVFSEHSVFLRFVSLLREGFRLRLAQGEGLGALVEGRRGAGRGLQEPPDGRVVQNSRVTLGSMLGHKGQQLWVIYHSSHSE